MDDNSTFIESEVGERRGSGITESDDGIEHNLTRPSDKADSTSNETDSGLEKAKYVPQLHHKARWKAMRRQYKDQYLELFRETYQDPRSINISTDKEAELPPSTIGVVDWTSDEKTDFFVNLSRRGMLNNAGLPASGSLQDGSTVKSLVEMQQYQTLLKEASDERQRFERRPEHIRHSDIPAAVEIGAKCETALEKAADALAALQDNYDHTAGMKTMSKTWIIDHHVAKALDEENDDSVNIDDAKNEQINNNDQADEAELFHLTMLLDLSERIFMNMPDASLHDHWKSIAEPGQRPCLTEDVLIEFHNLVVNLTRRIVQSAIFLAKSRIRSMTNNSYSPSKILSKEDVAAALDILNLPHDSWTYWASYARRSGARVILGSHSQGNSDKQTLSLKQVEHALSEGAQRGRRRSLSVLTDNELLQVDSVEDSNVDDYSDSSNSVEDSEIHSPVLDYVEDGDGFYDSEARSSDEDNAEDEEEVSEGEDVNDDHLHDINRTSLDKSSPNVAHRRPFDRKRRRLEIEAEEDQYMERLDQISRHAEERRLWQILDAPSTEETEDLAILPRPNNLRKLETDLGHWTDGLEYMAVWERDQKSVLQTEFDRSKIRKLR